MWVNLVRGMSAVLIIAIGYIGYLLYERQSQWTLEQKARLSADAWIQYFTSSVPEFEGLVETGAVRPEQLEALSNAKDALGVFRFKLFNQAGELTYLSDLIGGTRTEGMGLFQYNPGAANAISTGGVFVSIEDGTAVPDRPDAYAEVYVPIRGDEEAIGVVEVYVDMTDLLAVTQASFARFALLLSVLALGALTIPTIHWYYAWRDTRAKNATLANTVDRQTQLTREVQLLGDLNEWLQSSRSRSELFEMVVGFLTRLLPECEGEVYVYSNSRDVLDGCAAWNGGKLQEHIHPEDCWALRRGRTYEYGDAEISFPCEHVSEGDTRPYFCLPLLAHGETIGLLHLRQREDVTHQEFRQTRRLAQLCAEQISMAIANVKMRDELQDQSIRDALTGLFNRRHLMDALRRQMSRAARSGQQVALLSIDVDHFKRFNDTYGHDAGDMVLRAVGEVLDRATDGNEIACRPGGEEFMIVLPGQDTAEALHRAEDIREKIQAISLRYGEKTLPSITVSIGIAISPIDGAMPQDLMRAADEALYAAKAAGRNQAVLTTLMGFEPEEENGSGPTSTPAALPASPGIATAAE